jgi:hypothetical protein
MARPKKSEGKEGATLSIDVDSFVRTRDSVVTGLATLQDAIQTLSSAYIKHTNAVLGEHGAGLDVDIALTKLGENPLLGGLGGLQRAASPARSIAEGGSDKKERKKRQHDPNAPKRPLTAYFLFMQTARPIIATDLGEGVPKGAISTEGTNRWSNMSADDKALWTNLYKENLRLYNAKMHSYRAGNANAKDMTEEEAQNYAEEHNIGAETNADAQLAGEAATSAALVEEDEDAEGEEEITSPPPKTTPKAKGGRKAKAGKATPAVEEPAPTPIPHSSSVIAPPSKIKEASPDKKRKRTSKRGVDEPVNTVESEEPAVETPKSAKQPRKKKSKADA